MTVLPMAYAGALRQTHLIAALLPITPPPSDSRPQAKTLLHFAATGGSPHFIQSLLDAGYSASVPTPRSSELPFHIACAHKHEAAATLLLAQMSAADLRHADHSGWSALHYAAAANLPGLVRGVLARLGEGTPVLSLKDAKGRTALHVAAGYNATEALRALLAELPEGAAELPADAEGFTPLHTAARGGAAASITALLGAGLCAEVDAEAAGSAPLTPLHLAALGGRHEACMVLLAHGADPNRAVAAAAAAKDGKCAGATPLHFAVTSRSVRTVAILIDAGADVTSIDEMGRTPLHMACAAGSGSGVALQSILRMLVRNGAEIDAGDTDGNAPLGVAVAHGCVRAISELIEMGADPTLTNIQNQTPLHIAGRVGATTAVRTIMNHMWSEHSQKMLSCDP